jgi:predicted nucleic acid-binding protein
MKIYVLDASVVLSFLLEENSSLEKNFVKFLNQAKGGEVKLISSYLLPLELGNGLRFSLKDEDLAKRVLENFLKLPIEYFVFSEVHYEKILALSYQLGTSFYDTSYHFLAKILKGIFITTDKEYFEKAKNIGDIKLF